MRLQLTWTDPNTQQVRSPTLEPPIAFGRDFNEMPSALKGHAVRRMVLAGDQVAPFHAIAAEHKGHLVISDHSGGTETLVNGVAGSIQRVNDGDILTIGPFEIKVAFLTAPVAAQPTISAQPALAASGGSLGTSHSQEMNNASARPAWFGADGKCAHKVGFLFKRQCDRTTPEGCRNCQNGQTDPSHSLYNRYDNDYAYYPDYGRYDRGHWGHGYYHNRDHYYYDPHSRRVDFNESDAASFEQEGDQDYEMDLDAS